jgi:hypothetical protein
VKVISRKLGKKLSKLKAGGKAICYVSCHLRIILYYLAKAGKISDKVYEYQKNILIKQGQVKGNLNSCKIQHY